jgi:hypothetical protein
MPNLAKIEKERLNNDIWIGIRIHPYLEQAQLTSPITKAED